MHEFWIDIESNHAVINALLCANARIPDQNISQQNCVFLQKYLKDLSASSVASSICGGRQWSWRLIKPNATGPDMFWPISRSYCFTCPLCANRFKFWPCHVSTSQFLLHLATSRQAFLLNAMTLLAPTVAVAPTVGALTCPLCASHSSVRPRPVVVFALLRLETFVS